MKKKKALIIIITIILLICGGLATFFILKSGNQLAKKEDDTETYNFDVPGELTEYNYLCEMERENSNLDFKVYNLEKIKVEGENVISTQSLVRTEYKNKELYIEFKKDNPASEKIVYDDDKMIVIQAVTGIEDHKNNEENTNPIKYEDYQKSLKEIGYTCNKKIN